MMLLIDLGNSSIKWAWHRAQGLADPGASLHRGKLTACELDEHWAQAPKPERVIASTVASPTLDVVLTDWVQRSWGLAIEWAKVTARGLGLVNSYRDPSRMGVDRWLAMAAAHHEAQSHCCVIGVGTAVTVDLLRADGQHMGGWIAPGRALMRNALSNGTARIPKGTAVATDTWGSDTQSALALGIENAVAGLVQRAVQQADADLGSALIFVTGGDAPIALRNLRKGTRHRPHLVLEGLVLWSETC